jgi:hypothetical protein
MKISITFKDPDGVYESIQEAVAVSVRDIADHDEREAIAETRTEKVNAALKRWIEYGEYLRVDFDTDAMTATVRLVRG